MSDDRVVEYNSELRLLIGVMQMGRYRLIAPNVVGLVVTRNFACVA